MALHRLTIFGHWGRLSSFRLREELSNPVLFLLVANQAASDSLCILRGYDYPIRLLYYSSAYSLYKCFKP